MPLAVQTSLASALVLEFLSLTVSATATRAFPQQLSEEVNPPCVCIPAERNGEPYLDWAAWYFHECIYTHTERLGIYLGLTTIGIWSLAQLPQFWESYRLKRVEGISPGFIVQWLTGDTTNLIGCILTNQFETQLYTAIFFCLSDVLLVAQYCYYRFWYRQRRVSSHENTERQPLLQSPTSPISQTSHFFKTNPVATRVTILAGIGGLIGLIVWAGANNSGSGPGDDDRLEICDAAKELKQWQMIVGIIAAWGSGMLYFFSRIPQLLQNRRRRSVYGLSLLMFVLAITANIAYGASILLRLSKIDAHFWQSTLPFLIGSLGTLFSDFGIMIQAAVYRWEPPADEIEGPTDEVSTEDAT